MSRRNHGQASGQSHGHWLGLLAVFALVIAAFTGTLTGTFPGTHTATHSGTHRTVQLNQAATRVVLTAKITPALTAAQASHLKHLAHLAHLRYLAGLKKTAAAHTTAAVTGIASYARSFAGPPHYYVYGGEGPYGFDCSGLAQVVYRHFGISIPRTSEEQAASVTRTSSPQPGDLVSYWYGGDAYHTAIYLGGGMVGSALNPASGILVTPVGYPGSAYSYGVVH
jgi:cell wall-associated NlpC family hydrolase